MGSLFNRVVNATNATPQRRLSYGDCSALKNAENFLILKKSPELTQSYLTNANAHAAHSRPYQRTTAGATLEKENQVRLTEGEIHGNRKSNIYHLPECSGYERMSPANIVSFASEAEAVQAGYRKEKNCP